MYKMNEWRPLNLSLISIRLWPPLLALFPLTLRSIAFTLLNTPSVCPSVPFASRCFLISLHLFSWLSSHAALYDRTVKPASTPLSDESDNDEKCTPHVWFMSNIFLSFYSLLFHDFSPFLFSFGWLYRQSMYTDTRSYQRWLVTFILLFVHLVPSLLFFRQSISNYKVCNVKPTMTGSIIHRPNFKRFFCYVDFYFYWAK